MTSGPEWPEDSLTKATLAALQEADRAETPGGRAALLLARRLDMTTADTGSSIAALVREHRATLAAALANAQTGDQVDELKERRDRKRAAGAG